MLNANAAVWVPKPYVPPPPPPAASSDSPPQLDTAPAGSDEHAAAAPVKVPVDANNTAPSTASEDFDADFEEVLNALEELQESQINQEVEEQLMQEMEFYETEYDEFYDDEEDEFPEHSGAASSAGPPPGASRAPPPPFPRQRSGPSVHACKFTPKCRDGARRCRFSHQHMGACKYAAGCTNPACQFMH